MANMMICRTCEVHTKDLILLTTRAENYPDKTLADLLLELTKIDVSTDNGNKIPQQLCRACYQKLTYAYDFVKLALKTNERFLAVVQTEELCRQRTDCLLEAPIDLPIQQFLQVKLEVENSRCDDNALFTSFEDGINSELLDQKHYSQSEDMSVETEIKVTVGHINKDPITVGKEVDTVQINHSAKADCEINTAFSFINETSGESEAIMAPIRILRSSQFSVNNSEYVELPAKRRPGRPRLSKQKANQEGRFVCHQCGKSFAWHKDMQRHAKSHYSVITFNCEICQKGFIRKDKYKDHLRIHEKPKECSISETIDKSFGHLLYCGKRLKLISCKLCNTRFTNTLELRLHLEKHVDIRTLDALTIQSSVIREHFSLHNLENAKKVINEDIIAQSFSKYYVVLNAYGYECTLSDTDADDEIEKSPKEGKYNCQICHAIFPSKHLMYNHKQMQHANCAVPYQCNVCQMGFVCTDIYEQHMRVHCNNLQKKYQCTLCPGKFMWVENLTEHDCAGNNKGGTLNAKRMCEKCGQSFTAQKWDSNHICCMKLASKRQIQCCLCGKFLKKLKHLRQHLLIHRDGVTQVNRLKGLYFKTYYPADASEDEDMLQITIEIAENFEKRNYTLYYSAFSADGYELDLYDSDTTDGSDNEQPESDLYTCDICVYTSKRRKHIFQHQLKHNAQELPHICVDCGKQYVCNALLEQHRRRDCLNSLKAYQCDKCNARFVWHLNYMQHLNLQHADNLVKYEGYSVPSQKLQCEHCDKVFIWPKDLTRHRRIHMPESEKLPCLYCGRKFNRRDNLLSHMKVHSDGEVEKKQKLHSKEMHLCKPHGCKHIECMICRTTHAKITDLRAHLYTHKFNVKLPIGSEDYCNVESISKMLFPELPYLAEHQLIERIKLDVTHQNYERYYSITNEVGYELSIDSSETESDSDCELPSIPCAANDGKYVCDACGSYFKRKYQLYEHEQKAHNWQDAKFECVHCHTRFISNKLLAHHYRSLCKNTLKRYNCRKCPMRFRWKHNFKLHNDIHCNAEAELRKKNSATFECHDCKRSFQMQKDLTRHMFMHSRDSAIYSCHWCPRKFYRNENLLQHIARHGILPNDLTYAEELINSNNNVNGNKTIACKVCNLNFTGIAELRAHLLETPSLHLNYESMKNYSITNSLGYEMDIDDSETEEESNLEHTPAQYLCELCQLVCNRKHKLYRHQQAMHKYEKLTLKCEHCVYKCVSKDLLDHHMRTQCGNKEKQYKCDTCCFKFMWPENLKQHILLRHIRTMGQIDQDQVTSANERTIKSEQCANKHNVYQCIQCPRKYNRKDRLTAHIKKLHTPGVVTTDDSSRANNAIAKVKDIAEKRFLCAFCGKAVSSSSNLIIHMRRHTGEKPFKCDFCDMAFPRSSDMQCHRRTHTGEKPHKCTVCDKAFSRSYKLQQHMRIHNGDRPYKCTYCERSFTQSNDLTLHIRRHTGERPYLCGICGERFIQGTALKNHRIMRGHFEEVEEPVRRTILEQFRVS